ncbi:MAG TPA: GNAT family N-acetyltransferase [Candidatus Dormibacteraeota bacterium]|nr:GNAT family N-acetyltransferase [Candidatus Dormibacteraeota bacterium]
MIRGAVAVRPYDARDRAAVRRICHQTGYMGEPADWYWRNAESFADIWTGYYTDREPQSCLVAVRGDEVVGYLAGCVDSRAAPAPAAALARAALRHALLLRPGTAGFLWRGIADAVRQGGAPPDTLDDPRWPSHLHINLAPAGRGAGAGSALMAAWQARLAAAGSPGCHLGTLAENTRAVAFFARQGFVRHGDPALAPGMRTPAGDRMHIQFMVRAVG